MLFTLVVAPNDDANDNEKYYKSRDDGRQYVHYNYDKKSSFILLDLFFTLAAAPSDNAKENDKHYNPRNDARQYVHYNHDK